MMYKSGLLPWIKPLCGHTGCVVDHWPAPSKRLPVTKRNSRYLCAGMSVSRDWQCWHPKKVKEQSLYSRARWPSQWGDRLFLHTGISCFWVMTPLTLLKAERLPTVLIPSDLGVISPTRLRLSSLLLFLRYSVCNAYLLLQKTK